MGYKLVKFNVIPGENEQIDAVIKVPKEPRSVIHGVVLDECNRPRKDAVVKLLKECKNNPKRLEPITHTFTDEHGQFLFGPLCPQVKYVIKVWINHVKTREIVIKPEECASKCIDKEKHNDKLSKEEYEENYEADYEQEDEEDYGQGRRQFVEDEE